MNTGPSLGADVRGLLRRAASTYRDSPQAAGWLQLHLDRFDEPLRLAIAGKVKAGKSTLLNALVGEEIAPTDAGECTRVVTWYQDAPSPRVTLFPYGAAPRPLQLSRNGGSLSIDLLGTPPEEIDRLVVDWPSRSLRTTSLIDTPGIASLSQDTAARAGAFLTPDDAPTQADAVLYLMRHMHAADARFLESFHDQGVAKATPVNTIAILSRADEIGAGRLDALMSARKIAARYRTDDKLSGLCQTVVAVAGLLALTGRTLRQAEFVALTELSRLPSEDTELLLLSADRFTTAANDAVSAETRAALLGRFGIFGIRLAITLIRQGVDDPARLSVELVRRSGLDELREVLAAQFSQRRDLLKARSALLAVDLVLRREPRPEAAPLAADVERIFAGAHEFAELRLLSALRSKTVKLPGDSQTEAERLIGGSGGGLTTRLAVEPDADPAQLRAAVLDALTRWQRRSESPLSERAAADAARVIVRSCEGMLAALQPG